ncbi:hypothetical protein B0H11DRAFT_1934987 [Mycena galericulata]|nr:hypothetical protein B0H11DRAFT_1934987 [Mycena galericulata]
MTGPRNWDARVVGVEIRPQWHSNAPIHKKIGPELAQKRRFEDSRLSEARRRGRKIERANRKLDRVRSIADSKRCITHRVSKYLDKNWASNERYKKEAVNVHHFWKIRSKVSDISLEIVFLAPLCYPHPLVSSGQNFGLLCLSRNFLSSSSRSVDNLLVPFAVEASRFRALEQQAIPRFFWTPGSVTVISKNSEKNNKNQFIFRQPYSLVLVSAFSFSELLDGAQFGDVQSLWEANALVGLANGAAFQSLSTESFEFSGLSQAKHPSLPGPLLPELELLFVRHEFFSIHFGRNFVARSIQPQFGDGTSGLRAKKIYGHRRSANLHGPVEPAWTGRTCIGKHLVLDKSKWEFPLHVPWSKRWQVRPYSNFTFEFPAGPDTEIEAYVALVHPLKSAGQRDLRPKYPLR